MNKKSKLLVILICLAFVFGCTMFQKKPKSFNEMTPKEKVTFAYQIFNAQWEDYQAQAAHPETLTEGQKEILRKKRPVLLRLKTLIPAMDNIVMAGGVPLPSQEQQIYKMLNDLLMVVD